MTQYLLATFGSAVILIACAILVLPLCFVGAKVELTKTQQNILMVLGFILFMLGELLVALAVFGFLIGVWSRSPSTP